MEQVGQCKANPQNKYGLMQMGLEEKRAAVNAEITRMNQLPANSAFVIHRLKVLNKVMQLLSIQQRTIFEENELDQLLAQLSGLSVSRQ